MLQGDRFKNRLVSNAKLMKTLLRCCSRTADNYAIVMSFVDYLFDVFGDEMAAIGMTKQAWLDFIKNEWVPALKEIHISETQRRQLVDQYLQALMKKLSSWTLNAILKTCKLTKSRQFANRAPTPVLMLWSNASFGTVLGMSLGSFSALANDLGALRGQDDE